MKYFRFLLLFFLLNVDIAFGKGTEIDKAFRTRKAKGTTTFTLYSPEITPGMQMSDLLVNKRCGGKNISPKLVWINPPKNTVSFAIILKNLDNDKLHWGIYNIPAKIRNIPGNATGNMSEGIIELSNDFGTNGFSGLCFGDNNKHNFILKLYALNTSFTEIDGQIVPSMFEKNKIASTEIKAFYQKKHKYRLIQSNAIKKEVL